MIFRVLERERFLLCCSFCKMGQAYWQKEEIL